MKNIEQLALVVLLIFNSVEYYCQTVDGSNVFQCRGGGSLTALYDPQWSFYGMTVSEARRPSFAEIDVLNSSPLYKGKVVRRKGTCKWLIRITDANDVSWVGKLILPTGDFDEGGRRLRGKVKFEMTPLRQEVPVGCKAGVVASISILTED